MLPVFYVQAGHLFAELSGEVIFELDCTASDFREQLQYWINTCNFSDGLFSSTVDHADEEGAPAELRDWIEDAMANLNSWGAG